MKKLFAILLTLALLIPCAAAFAEEAPVTLGYITRLDEDEGWHTLCAGAFAYAAERQGVEARILTYDLSGEEVPEDADGEERTQLGMNELLALIESGVDGVVIAPATLEQAVALIDCANAAGVPVVIEGMNVASAYPPEPAPGETSSPEPTPDPAEARPYVAAVAYGDSAAYAACMWLEEDAYNPLLFHCALTGADPAIITGMRRALAGARYLTFAYETRVGGDSISAGRKSIQQLISSFASIGCVLADSAALAEGCADVIRGVNESWPVAAVSSSPEALALLKAGKIDMVAATPASLEGVRTFEALHNFVTEGIRPETETGFVRLDAIVATRADASAWIDSGDFETAYALVYPEPAEEAETVE